MRVYARFLVGFGVGLYSDSGADESSDECITRSRTRFLRGGSAFFLDATEGRSSSEELTAEAWDLCAAAAAAAAAAAFCLRAAAASFLRAAA
eukprot:6186791-Pleurochrysis_carterae.AAC.1